MTDRTQDQDFRKMRVDQVGSLSPFTPERVLEVFEGISNVVHNTKRPPDGYPEARPYDAKSHSWTLSSRLLQSLIPGP